MYYEKIRLTESQFNRLIKETVRNILKENECVDFYSEEDEFGNVGEPGMVKSYNIGYYSVDNAMLDAKEFGYENLQDYLKFWWNEVSDDIPFTWEKLGSGYGYHGTTLLKLGNVVFKEIYGQIMVDEYAPC